MEKVKAIPTIQVRSKSIVLYERQEYAESRAGKRGQTVERMREVRSERYSGAMSKGSVKRIKKAVDLLVASAEVKYLYNEVTGKYFRHKLSFITLTISSQTRMLSAKEGHKLLLEPFIKWLRQNHGVTTYVWKAELQKRGQLHYHITIHNYIHWRLIRNKWNQLQRKHGLLDEYYETNGHHDANSTDIHEVYNINDLGAYLMKYIAKENYLQHRRKKCKGYNRCEFQRTGSEAEIKQVQTRCADSEFTVKKSKKTQVRTEGKLWDCSRNLKDNSYFEAHLCEDNHYLITEALKDPDNREVKGDYFYLLYLKNNPAETLLTPSQLTQYKYYLYRIAHPEECS